MPLSSADQERIHSHGSRHRAAVLASTTCGCFYCGALFAPAEIARWIDETPRPGDGGLGQTALCPRCDIDAVLPDNVPGAALTPSLLAELRAYWF